MLNKKTCIPCQGGIPPLNSEEISKYLNDINENWINLIDVKISRTFNFNNYLEALNFVNKIAYLSEDEGHHPHVHLNFKNVEVIILEEPAQIFPSYEKSLNRQDGKSTILVEYGDYYQEK